MLVDAHFILWEMALKLYKILWVGNRLKPSEGNNGHLILDTCRYATCMPREMGSWIREYSSFVA